jgi:hypothetical protein
MSLLGFQKSTGLSLELQFQFPSLAAYPCVHVEQESNNRTPKSNKPKRHRVEKQIQNPATEPTKITLVTINKPRKKEATTPTIIAAKSNSPPLRWIRAALCAWVIVDLEATSF